MMARIRKSVEEKDQGFTLIELLVVMIIIGILAAIAVPVFLSQRAKARETSAKSDVSVIGKEVAAYYVDGTSGLKVGTQTNPRSWTLTTGASPLTTTVGALSYGNLSAGNTASGTATDAMNWCVQVATATSTDQVWKYTSQNGLVAGAC